MLQKILKTIKKRNKEENQPSRNFMPYPFPFMNPYNPLMFMGRYNDNDDIDDRRRGITPDIKYIPIPEEPQEKTKDEGRTIRKKSKIGGGENNENNGKVSKSAVFEKIFYKK